MVDRPKQLERDRYYMGIAHAVREGADCLGTLVGAVVVLGNRVVSTGYNGTPEGFLNCRAGGCVRCTNRMLEKTGRHAEMTDPAHVAGRSLDHCICVHAEQNAFITAARHGIRLEGATVYSTSSPCFGCLKEAVQAGIQRIVYDTWYPVDYADDLAEQYRRLYEHLAHGDPHGFEVLGGGRPPIEAGRRPDA